MGAHEDDCVLLETLTGLVILQQVSAKHTAQADVVWERIVFVASTTPFCSTWECIHIYLLEHHLVVIIIILKELLYIFTFFCIRNMEKMSRVTTALSSSAITGRTMFCHLDAPANAISVCRDATQVVVAGRNIFKIYALEEEQFVEKLNLRVGRKPSLNFSCADVMWHQMEENLLATAATNGAVVTWNLGKPSRNKQDQLFTEHKRTVNKVCFHPTEAHMLLSGSQDGFMKCFDLRKKESVSTFSGEMWKLVWKVP